ncbi:MULTISPECIES: protein kinase [unclassified Streptomyces]|uniref:protein kinase n=1 Tax=unclassified Streptomyces TaxID=2593676 RepID=UPI00382A35EF
MDEYAGRVLADRYRLPLPPSDEYDLVETRAFDTYSGQEVLVRQVPLPEVVEAEVVEADGGASRRVHGRTARKATDPAVRRAIEAAQSAAQIPDHPRLDQVFDVFAEAGSLWIVSELVAARPLAALLAEKPLNPFRAAEIASDVLTAVRVVHAHGWTHRNITVRTVLVCDDGRVVLTGLAAGAAEEALCGYAPVPEPPDPDPEPDFHPGEGQGRNPGQGPDPVNDTGRSGPQGHQDRSGDRQDALGSQGRPELPDGFAPSGGVPGTARQGPAYDPGPTVGVPGASGHAELERARPESPYGDDTSSGTSGAFPRPQGATPGVPAPFDGQPALPSGNASGDIRAARAGAIAAYRAGARAAALAGEDQNSGRTPVPPLPEQGTGAGTGTGTSTGTSTSDLGSGTGNGPREAPRDTGPDPDWWAQPRGFSADPDGDADADEDDDPPTPYRPRLAGTWRDGPAPWNDASGSVPAGGGGIPGGGVPGGGSAPYGRSGPYGSDSGGSLGGGATSGTTSGIPVSGIPVQGDADQRPGTDLVMARGGGDTPYRGPGSGSGGRSDGGGGRQSLGAHDALHADAQRQSLRLPAVAGGGGGGRWDEVMASSASPAYRGPATPLAAERARQARIAVVGAVTERWSPEQAGPVHENWQLAPPIGPATDLWALGALLYRAVQGHAPYPEESAIELVQLVCAEPPAFAEECGPLRPVVESLLRQDPTERPDFEELRGWLRSLVRSAPEPEAGLDVVPLLSEDATKLPIKRRRGELVRKRRRRDLGHGRHRQKKGNERKEKAGRAGKVQKSAGAGVEEPGRYEAYEAPLRPETEAMFHRQDRLDDRPDSRLDDGPVGRPGGRSGGRSADRWDDRQDRDDKGRGPRSLGRNLLLLILLLLVLAVGYAVVFLPKADTTEQKGQSVGEASPSVSSAPRSPTDDAPASNSPAEEPNTSAPGTSGPAADVADGYALRDDTEGFRTAVDKDWQRRPINDSGQVRYVGGDFTLIVVPGRDSVADNGDDPLAYQRDKERELQPFRDSSWSSATGLRRIDVGRQAMAEGQYTWQDSSGRQVYVRNLAMIIEGRYHIVQVIGPDDQRDQVSEIYQQATGAYRVTG